MNDIWIAVIIGSLAVYSWKLLGYLIPKRFAQNKSVAKFAGLLTIALLASLAAVQTVASNKSIELDSRILAIAVSAVLFWRKLPFLFVIATAAAIAAGARYLLGWP